MYVNVMYIVTECMLIRKISHDVSFSIKLHHNVNVSVRVCVGGRTVCVMFTASPIEECLTANVENDIFVWMLMYVLVLKSRL